MTGRVATNRPERSQREEEWEKKKFFYQLHFAAGLSPRTRLDKQSMFPHLCNFSPSTKVKCTSSHLGQKRLCKPNKDTSPWEINSCGPFLCNLFLSPGRMNSFPRPPFRPEQETGVSAAVERNRRRRKELIYLRLQLCKWLIFWRENGEQTLDKYDKNLQFCNVQSLITPYNVSLCLSLW